jgi:hypothetical protein
MGQSTPLVANWSLAQVSVRGRPPNPERVSIVLDDARLERATAAGTEMLAKAAHLELHARENADSAPGKLVIDIALRLAAGVAPEASPLTSEPFDADVTGVMRGLKDLRPKPIALRLREWQEAGGRLEITSARLKQGESIASAVGSIGLSQSGRLDGTLQVTVAGIEQLVSTIGLDRLLASRRLDSVTGGTAGRERLAPALTAIDRLITGGSARGRAEARLAAAGLSLLGEPTQLEGRKAIAMPLRVSDGTAYLGPLPLGQTGPLY